MSIGTLWDMDKIMVDEHQARQEPSDCQERCPYCGITPFKQEQIHGHYLCVNCRTVTTGCCDGNTG